MALTIKTKEQQLRVFVVSLEGSLDGNTSPDLEKQLAYLIHEGKAKVVTLDLAKVNFLSSMGVRVIFKAKKDLAAGGGELCMVNPSTPVKKVFEIIQALPSVQIFTSIEEMDAYLAKIQSDLE